MLRLTLRIDREGRGWLGPGKVRLLEAIETTGSIRKAATTLGMSYRRAWLLLKALEETVQRPLTEKASGGRAGGGTCLTKVGTEIVRRYRAIERKSARASASELRALEAMSRGGSRARSAGNGGRP